MPYKADRVYGRWSAVVLALAIAVAVGEARAAGNPAAGKTKSALCAACHGADGNSEVPTTPKLAGQRAEYILMEMEEFRLGRRKDSAMNTVASAVVDPTDLQDIAAYYAAQPRQRGSEARSPAFALGERLFFEERCMYCHGERAEGGIVFEPFLTTAAALAGQHKAYLIKALRDIRDGTRPTDRYGLMQQSLTRLNDKQIEAIAEFLSGL